ncbi:unnamed protein product [Candidula unifasciata]|uniref:N-acetyltransferase domain-containing protein n=1 Tax=Candidula unifasciata TaxID=100452 RepID=A0A8S3ZRW8_9EUPU|nr:unnamed protein product [Candidula unifasciata]
MLPVTRQISSAFGLKNCKLTIMRVQLLRQLDRWCRSMESSMGSALMHTTAHLHLNTQQSPNRVFDGKSDLTRFLIEVGTDPKEARYWMKTFLATSEPSEVFMVVSLDNEVMESHAQLDTFASTISFLYRNGLSPLIVCGSRADHPFKVMKEMCIWNAVKLSDMIEQHGTYTRLLYPGCGLIYSKDNDPTESSGLAISTDLITRSLSTKHLPILLSFGETPTGQLFPVKSWDLTCQISRMFQPKKVMLVNSRAGFMDKHGKVIANINLPSDLATASQKDWCTPEIVDTMARVNKLLTDLPSESSVVITSADTLLRELFSHRGSGTFFRATEAIHKYTSLKGIDLERLTALLNRALELTPGECSRHRSHCVLSLWFLCCLMCCLILSYNLYLSFMVEIKETYFDDIADQIHAIYLSETYSGVAILLRCEEQGVPYLCKFAVTNKAQGQGTGELLWDTITQSEKTLFWRSKNINPINTWYGIEDPHLSSGLIHDAISRKDSFKRGGVIASIVSDDEEERMGG